MEHSAYTSSTTPSQMPLGVAFSGGGARGFAHAGALMAIEEAGLKPDVIAGVSAGAVVAVLYAAGCKPIEIATIFSDQGFSDFVEFNIRKGGLFNIRPFEDFILRHTNGITKIEDLLIPTYIGATDFDHGRAVAFTEGNIGPRLRASCSIPIIFTPVEIDGINYVDGGVLRNMPSWTIRDKCRTLIGVNVSPLRKYDTSSMIGVTMRTYNLMAKANQTQDMELCDIAIELNEISNYKVFDLQHIQKVFVSGYMSMRSALRKADLWKPDKSKNFAKISDLVPTFDNEAHFNKEKIKK